MKSWAPRLLAMLAVPAVWGTEAVRSLKWAELPAAVRPFIAGSEKAFQTLLRETERSTAERIRRGEAEHFTYFALQSRSFTSLPPIEPALSAREFQRGGGTIPAAVAARLKEFQAAKRTGGDERLAWFQRHTPRDPAAAYVEAMRFLQAKEYDGSADVYQQRGYSSDARPEASFPVWTALAVIRQLDPVRPIRRVLIVGPGLDWAPRTDFDDAIPPQSYQPALVRGALLDWKLSRADQLEVLSGDVNPRVVHFLQKARPFQGVPWLAGSDEYREFDAFARRVLAGVGQPPTTAVRLNILTQRLPRESFDLVVATNVLVYFTLRELALALASIHSMLAPGGWLIHNEVREDLEPVSQALGMGPAQGRTLLVAQGARRPLLDAFVLHRKR